MECDPFTSKSYLSPKSPSFPDYFHLMLLTGRILLQHSTTTERVHQTIQQLAEKFGVEVRVYCEYEAIKLTVKSENEYSSHFSRPITSIAVNMALITQVFLSIEKFQQNRLTLTELIQKLEKIDKYPPIYYPRWFIILMLGLTGASLARIFQGDWASFVITGIATAVGVILRQELGKRHFNPFLLNFLAAFLGGCIGGVAGPLGWSSTPNICFLIPSMMLVPGVHLINGVLDLVENHIPMGMARLEYSLVILSSIAFGLLLSTTVTNALLPVSNPVSPLPLLEDVIFAGLAAMGFAIFFNVPPKMLWACIICGMVGHGVRWLCIDHGPGIIWGNLIASAVVGTMALYFSHRFHAPPAVIAFGAVVGIVPGIFAFQAASGLIQIMTIPENASSLLLATTLGMMTKAFLMTLAIPIGLAIPILLRFQRQPNF